MRKLMILLLGAILIGILSYFCFSDKADGIKDDLNLKTKSAYAAKQMDWVHSDIKGDDLEMTRIVTLDGTAPNAALKAEAGRIALTQDGVTGVDNRLLVAEVTEEVVEKSVEVEVASKPDPIPVVDVEVVAKPDPIPVVEVEVPAKVVENVPKKPVEVVYSCQDEFQKVLLGKKISFASNKSTIKSDSYGLLDDLVSVINRCPDDAVAISGHTDSDGSARYNKKLSASRADAVKKYLIDKGISVERLKAVGYGEDNPIADNATDEGKSKNRRIEFDVIDIKDVPIVEEPEDSSELKEVTAINFDDIPDAKTIRITSSDNDIGSVKPGTTVGNVSQKAHAVAASCQNKFIDILSSGKIQFAYNRANIKPQSHQLLDELANIAKGCPDEFVTISGYTDSDGSDSYNKRLSAKRATAVKDYLINSGIPSRRLKAVGYGESNPIADNSTKEGKEKNRRIEFNVKGVR